MLPPSDSIKHQSLKLAEFITNLQQSQKDSRAPPPPYAATENHTSDDSFADYEDDDDGSNMSPILIKIDTSINIDGQGNTIVIPTSAGEETANPQQIAEKASLAQLQQQRQAKSAQLASTIIAALKSSGALDASGKQRPIEISVNSGISIKGDRNVVCAAATKRVGPRQEMDRVDADNSSLQGRKRRADSQPAEIPSTKRPQR